MFSRLYENEFSAIYFFQSFFRACGLPSALQFCSAFALAWRAFSLGESALGCVLLAGAGCRGDFALARVHFPNWVRPRGFRLGFFRTPR